MIDGLFTALEGSGTGPGAFSVLLVIRGTLLLSAGFLLARILSKASASSRHAVWVATFLGLMALPFLAVLGPALPLEVLAGAPERKQEQRLSGLPSPQDAIASIPSGRRSPPSSSRRRSSCEPTRTTRKKKRRRPRP
jgi:hypothetical protein